MQIFYVLKDCKLMLDSTTQHYFFHELNLTFIHRFSAANHDHDPVLSFFQARHVSEIILNEFSKRAENALIE
jgi:hypothetical protein